MPLSIFRHLGLGEARLPIILGRPFLAIGRAMIDVHRGELKLRVQDDEVKFNVFEAVRHLAKSDTCFMIETVEAIMSSQSGLTDLWRLAWYRVNQKNWEKRPKSM